MGNFIYTPEEVQHEVCKGNLQATLFIFHIVDALHLYDDLIDKDQAPSDEAIHKAFWNMLVAIPSNAFYQQNIITLQALLQLAIENWKIATSYEREPLTPTDLPTAFILRSTYIDLVTTVARLVGGHEHAVQVGSKIHRICHCEGYDTFVAELKRERAAREQKEKA